jgi:hypothetical protein
VRGQKRVMAVAMAAAALAMGSPSSPANADEFSCETTALAPFDTTVDAVAADLPLIEFGQSVSCSSSAVIAMTIRPEVRVDESQNVWSPAGPAVSGTKPGFHTSASMKAWFKCTRGYYRTEARVHAGSYFLGAADTDEDVSSGRSVDCRIKVKVG